MVVLRYIGPTKKIIDGKVVIVKYEIAEPEVYVPSRYKDVDQKTVRYWMGILALSSKRFLDKKNEFDTSDTSAVIWEDLTNKVLEEGIDTIEEFMVFMESYEPPVTRIPIEEKEEENRLDNKC